MTQTKRPNLDSEIENSIVASQRISLSRISIIGGLLLASITIASAQSANPKPNGLKRFPRGLVSNSFSLNDILRGEEEE